MHFKTDPLICLHYSYVLCKKRSSLIHYFICGFSFMFSSKLQVQLGDHVVIKGERTGRIRYIGHLDKIGQPNLVFAGLELDAPGEEATNFCFNT